MTGFARVGRRAGVLAGTLALAGAGLVGGLSTSAGAITVTTEAGLRAAFGDANQTKIDLANDITLSVCTGPFFGEVRRVSPNVALTLDGHGFTVRQTCSTAGVFGQNGDEALTFQNVTITGGHQDNADTCYGGGIRTSSPVTVINSAVSSNFARCSGGGISVSSELTVINSTVSGNTTGIADDTDAEGGGIFHSSSAPFTMTNSTVSGNTAFGGLPGGGIRTFGEATLVYSTVVNNTAVDGSNLSGYTGGGATLEIFGSVVALPQGGGTNCAGFVTTTSNGYNWDNDGSCGFGAGPGDHSNAGDPQLGALAANGGPTQTREPLTGSPLIDAIPSGSCEDDGATGITTDQRALPRPALNGCDIGAVEVQPTPPEPSPVPSPVAAAPRFTG